jgi:16S rRNA (cytosine967-C5)-methyltransferase
MLRRVRTGQPFDAAQDQAVDGLPESDRRLAHEIAAGVLRHRTELDDHLRRLVSRGWQRTAPDLKDLLRIGAYQLTRLDRIPAHAAVETTVEVAKRIRGNRGAGLVNAVLRRVAQQEPTILPAQPAGDVAALARAHSHPRWLVHRWVTQFGFERGGALLVHNNQRPRTVIRPVRWSLDRVRDALLDRGVEVRDAPFEAGLEVSGCRVPDLPGYADGGFVVQDPAQACLLQAVDIPTNARVWDACSAPGGKAAVLSRTTKVLASDYRHNRLTRLRATLARAAPHVPIVVADARFPPIDPHAFDVVLVDAPCSATGTLARHPDGRWRLSERHIARMVGRQRDLLEGVVEAFRPGGMLVYITCSLEREENQDQIDGFLDRHQDFARAGPGRFLFPPDHGTDGGYAAPMRRAP